MNDTFKFMKFAYNTRGGIAPLFALALLPILISAGAAMDYSRKERDSKTMQNAADSAVLAGGTELINLKKSEIEKLVRKFVYANVDSNIQSQIKNISTKIDKVKGTITVTINGATPTTMLSIVGKTKLEYKVEAASRAASGKMEVVLVLDNTFSMSVDNKLVDLKAAAGNFVDQLMKSNKNKKVVKVGIVPFSQYVNVGLDNRKAKWLDVADDSKTTVNRCYYTRKVISRYNCRKVTRYRDGVPYSSTRCSYKYGPKYRVCRPSTRTYKWYGCVGSRKTPLNLKDARPDKPVPGLLNQRCPSRLTELTDKKKILSKKISSMVATGETYIPTGLMWGLRLISSESPFMQGVSYTKAATNKVQKIIVLMTDGENQRSAQLPNRPHHWGRNLVQANSWTTQSCNEIKSKDITLYSVTFGSAIPATAKSLIRGCATDPTKYFHAASGNQLNKAFEKILGDLNKLRLTH